MRYLIVDPVGTYASRFLPFLSRLGLEGVAVFSSPSRQAVWERRWRARLGEHVVAEHAVRGGEPLAKLARRVRRDAGDGLLGIIPWDEMHILFAAELGEHLGLGWNPRRVIERCRDKDVMKAWLRSVGSVRINAGRVVRNAGEAFAFQEELGKWPIVVKPSGGAGAMDVYFAVDRGELLGACQEVLEAGAGKVLLEEYVDGRELAVNGMVDDEGGFLLTDVWLYDKRTSHGVPNLYYQSIKLSSDEPLFRAAAAYAADVIDALELRRAPVHMEVKVDDEGPCLIEVGARLAGGDQPVLASKLHGRSLFELAACHYLEKLPLSPRDVDFERYDRFHARIVSGIQPFEIRRVRAVHGVEEVEALPSFAGFGSLWPPGCRVPVTRDLDTKSYEVYLFHADPRQVAHDSERIRRLLRYE